MIIELAQTLGIANLHKLPQIFMAPFSDNQTHRQLKMDTLFMQSHFGGSKLHSGATAALGQADISVTANVCLWPLRPPPNIHQSEWHWRQGGGSVLPKATMTHDLERAGIKQWTLRLLGDLCASLSHCRPNTTIWKVLRKKEATGVLSNKHRTGRFRTSTAVGDGYEGCDETPKDKSQ